MAEITEAQARRPADRPLAERVRPFDQTHSIFDVLRATFWPVQRAAAEGGEKP